MEKRERNVEGVTRRIKHMFSIPEPKSYADIREPLMIAHPRMEEKNTILKGSKVVGDLVVSQDLEISGDVEGNITAEQRSNIVIRGNCKGSVRTKEGNIEIEGEISGGDITAGGSVKITGRFNGRKIEAKEKISINGGFTGTLQGNEIELGPNSQGKGDLFYREYISIHRGADVEVRVHKMPQPEKEKVHIPEQNIIDMEVTLQKKNEPK
ncbi:MAG: bactofilin family protein [bacterium]